MEERATAAAPRGEAVRRHRDDRVKRLPIEIAERPGPPDHGVQLIVRILATGRFGHDLLSEHVERRIVRHDPVEVASPDRSQQRSRLDQIVARDREEPALRHAGRWCAPIARCAEGAWRSGGASRSGTPDRRGRCRSQLERGGGHQCLQLSAFEPRFGVEPLLLRQAAMVRRDRLVAEALAQMTRDPFGHAARVDEHERRAMLRNQLGEPVVVLLPHLVRHHRFERRPRQLQAEIDLAPVPFVDDRRSAAHPDASTAGVPTRKRATSSTGFCVADRPMRSSGDRPPAQPFQAQRKMRPAARADDGVDLIDDDGSDRAAACRGCVRRSAADRATRAS